MEKGEGLSTLNELFDAMYRPGDAGAAAMPGARRPLREALLERFFPEALCRQYLGKSPSNLTWFFSGDGRNRAMRRALAAMAEADARGVLEEMHAKCRSVLWPDGQAAFDPAGLRAALNGVRLRPSANARWHIVNDGVDGGDWVVWRLDAYFDVDPSAALARMLLTLAIQGEAADAALGRIWLSDPGATHACMAADDTLAGQIRYARMLDMEGRGDEAFAAFERLARRMNRPAQTAEESAMYCRLAEMMYAGDGRDADEKGAMYYFLLACLDAYPRSYYLLASHSSGQAARQALEQAAALQYPPAVRALGEAWFNGSARYGCVRSLDRARQVFQPGLELPGADGAYCAWMLGQIYEAQGDLASALSACRVAANRGSAEAAAWLTRHSPARRENARDDRDAGFDFAPSRHCVINGLDGANRAFLDGLRGGWDVVICPAEPLGSGALPEGARLSLAGAASALEALLKERFSNRTPVLPTLSVALLSGNLRENLMQALAALGVLQRHARTLGLRADDLVERVSVYVLADRDEAAPLLDAACAAEPERAFALRLCDPALDAADQLFAGAPLFLPLMADGESAVRLNILGGGDDALAVARRAMGLPMPEGALSIAIFAPDAPALERRFHRLCPGAAAEGAGAGCPVPVFYPWPQAGEDGDAARRLTEGNYFAVAAGDDVENLDIALRLRRELLRGDGRFDRLPFIAALVRRPEAAWLTAALSPEESAPGRWYGRYDLFAFGSWEMYAPERLRADATERRARQAYRLYEGLPDTPGAGQKALDGYYRRQSRRDSARATACALIYRAFLAGARLPGWQLYGAPEEEARLAPRYARWLKQPGSLEAAVAAEHRRWCGRMLSDGWTGATPEQTAAYARRGNPGHVQALTRMHPFLCPWAALKDGERLNAVRRSVRQWLPDKSVPDPRKGYEAAVKDTEWLLGMGSRE